MRITADIVESAPQRLNCIREREISFRGYKIPVIENLGVTQDQFDTIDLSDNSIKKLENFPVLKRLQTILLNNNQVSKIATGLGEFLPKLENIILCHNKIGKNVVYELVPELG
eukprot:TRINITY_DN15482_c0_g1_i1.p1 TRINITY_DN15482_c0_g1~~TRINITY_DN15482_c0_g1_i1.p1  ORF type:complete len:113 (-),score=21.51 TRINITY_DN15482_c0_g1_i1:96-434(-)